MSRPKPDSKSAEDYRNRQYETFQMIGSVPEDWRWDGSEPTENRDSSGAPAGECGLCEKHPIAYEFTLVKKADSMTRLIVGSECVHTFIDAEPWTAQRKAADKMKRMTLVNKMTNHLLKTNDVLKGRAMPYTYQQAHEKADEMTDWDITSFFTGQARRRAGDRLRARADVLAKFMNENRGRLWDQNWFYFQPRTILSSLSYMMENWRQGRDTPYMNGPMNAALAKLGLELPVAPKEEKA
jgi:hypothetical protein